MLCNKVWASLSIIFGALAITTATAASPGADARAVPQAPARAVEVVDYSDHVFVRVEAATPDEIERVNRLGVNLSCRMTPGPQPLIIDRDRLPMLQATGMRYRVLEENVQAHIDAQRAANDAARAQRDSTFYTAYRTLAEISDLIDTIVATNPAIASRVSVGTSLEERDIFGIVIKGVNAPADAPVFVINGCQHAREWVSPMAVCYTAEQLVTQYGTDPQITELVDSIEFHIVPVVNPDGYVYTWSTDRYWRKNRRNNGNGTFGVDLNRNWSLQWGGAGSSGSSSSDLYRGPSPFSEPRPPRSPATWRRSPGARSARWASTAATGTSARTSRPTSTSTPTARSSSVPGDGPTRSPRRARRSCARSRRRWKRR